MAVRRPGRLGGYHDALRRRYDVGTISFLEKGRPTGKGGFGSTSLYQGERLSRVCEIYNLRTDYGEDGMIRLYGGRASELTGIRAVEQTLLHAYDVVIMMIMILVRASALRNHARSASELRSFCSFQQWYIENAYRLRYSQVRTSA